MVAPLDLPLPQPGESGPYALVGTARAKPNQAEALEGKLLALVGPTRRESGSLAYHVHRDRSDPDLFVFYEVWSSVEALRVHLMQPYIQAFLSERHAVLDGDLSVTWLRMQSSYA